MDKAYEKIEKNKKDKSNIKKTIKNRKWKP